LFRRTHLLFRRTHLLFRRTHLLFRRTHLLFRRTHLLFRRTHLLFRRTHNVPHEINRRFERFCWVSLSLNPTYIFSETLVCIQPHTTQSRVIPASTICAWITLGLTSSLQAFLKSPSHPVAIDDIYIAPFTSEQIRAFAQKWFVAFSKTNIKDGQSESAEFIQKLDLAENWQFCQLVVTPLFLHLACWVFHGQEKFPTKRTDFYKQGLDLLLGKWDEAKGIERDEVYRGFLLPQKLKLIFQKDLSPMQSLKIKICRVFSDF
ncbi:NACHT domain-containing protein, partial [Nostoc commune]|uniref:NACHT domain-containing protein n=1 Tax=Nostoc commune TaxID=1178 RepID=UPI0039BF66AC